MRFALYEAKVALVSLVSKYRLFVCFLTGSKCKLSKLLLILLNS